MSSPEPQAAKPSRRRSAGVVVPHAPRWYQRLGAWLVFALVWLIGITLRYRWNDPSGHYENKAPGPTIYCVWHNRLALCMIAYHTYARRRNPTRGMAALVSASKDGGFLAAILECFRVQPVRGSSSRRGPQALLELTTWAERGWDLAITPDGPRGPCYQVQDGVMALAQVTGMPVLPFSYYLKWKVRVKSWDRFQIPLPFSVCEMNFGKPVRVARDCTDEKREILRLELEKTLRAISKD